MKLQELITKIKEENLTKDQLENYRDALAQLFAELQLEMSELEKDEALYMSKNFIEEVPITKRKIMWKSTPNGQRLIVLKRYASATRIMMTSLRDRLYNFY